MHAYINASIHTYICLCLHFIVYDCYLYHRDLLSSPPNLYKTAKYEHNSGWILQYLASVMLMEWKFNKRVIY